MSQSPSFFPSNLNTDLNTDLSNEIVVAEVVPQPSEFNANQSGSATPGGPEQSRSCCGCAMLIAITLVLVCAGIFGLGYYLYDKYVPKPVAHLTVEEETKAIESVQAAYKDAVSHDHQVEQDPDYESIKRMV